MLGRLLRIAQRQNDLRETDYRVMRKVRDGQLLSTETDDETDAWWWLVREEYIAYQFQGNSWLTDKGKQALEKFDNVH